MVPLSPLTCYIIWPCVSLYPLSCYIHWPLVSLSPSFDLLHRLANRFLSPLTCWRVTSMGHRLSFDLFHTLAMCFSLSPLTCYITWPMFSLSLALSLPWLLTHIGNVSLPFGVLHTLACIFLSLSFGLLHTLANVLSLSFDLLHRLTIRELSPFGVLHTLANVFYISLLWLATSIGLRALSLIWRVA